MKLVQKVLVKYKNKFLILLKSPNSKNFPNLWDFPGGKPKEGESLLQSLTREVFEETGLKIKIYKLIRNIKIKFKGKSRLYKIYSSKIISGKLKLSEEHTKFKWVTKKEIAKLNIHPFMEKLQMIKI